ncbi:MAG TPA: 2-C-methyl-D-erythritol 2,4-cyclodiphosphate synthase, partial [Longimicrobiales bacterium]|nr:2-C-methyl-D-erythritol 2,4-cyclodiphosphate synthase [Longimicrobiales bacterium]
MIRIGIGYDSHRFKEGRKLILGGVEIPFEKGLDGHSDADAVSHAITDAMLGAAALGDIGMHFPPSDARWKNANSLDLLKRAQEILTQNHFKVINIDVSVICEEPRIGPNVQGMRNKLSATLGLSFNAISIKGKTNEGMGWIGRGEGIAT